MEFKNQLKIKLSSYVKKLNDYNELSQQLLDLKYEKQNLEEEIIYFMQKNDLDNKIFVLNNCKIQHKKGWQYQNISLKLIEKTLQEYCELKSIPINVENYLLYIKENRDKKQKDELKIHSI